MYLLVFLTVAIKCIMCVCVCVQKLMISDIPLMNAEVSVEFRGSSFKVRGRESDGEDRGKGEHQDILSEGEIRETQTVRITYGRIDKGCYSKDSNS